MRSCRLAFIEDVRTFAASDDERVRKMLENIRTIRERFESEDTKAAA